MYLYGYEFIKHWVVVNYVKGKGKGKGKGS